jgi:hypothetical protein
VASALEENLSIAQPGESQALKVCSIHERERARADIGIYTALLSSCATALIPSTAATSCCQDNGERGEA